MGLDEVHVHGHSWGGMLEMAYALTRPSGLRSLIVASAPASAPRWAATAMRLREELPERNKRALTRCERTVLAKPVTKSSKATTSAAVRKKAKAMQKSLPVLASTPGQVVAAAASHLPPLRRAAYPILTIPFMTRFAFRGTQMPVGMLVAMAGMNQAVYESMWGPSEFVDPDQVRDMAAAIPRAEWVLFEDAAHSSEFEEPDRYADLLADFLERADPPAG